MAKKQPVSTEEIDSLLEEIEDDDAPVANDASVEKPKPAALKIVHDDVPEPKHNPQHITIDTSKVEAAEVVAKNDAAALLIEQILKQFGERSGAIWDKVLEDRTQLDKYINIFMDRIAEPENVKACYVEGLTALLSVKATSSINASKLLDSIAKMVAAVKNIKSESTDTSLDGILNDDGSQPTFDEKNP